jgi:putative FmdB family regulatory protein
MPLFGFNCKECGTQFEEWVPNLGAIEQVICSNCGSRTVQRQLSRVAGIQKAGGFPAASSGPSCAPGGI